MTEAEMSDYFRRLGVQMRAGYDRRMRRYYDQAMSAPPTKEPARENLDHLRINCVPRRPRPRGGRV